jgi:hypothetical protein
MFLCAYVVNSLLISLKSPKLITAPPPQNRKVSQKGLFKLVCKLLGLYFIVQTVISAQRTFFIAGPINEWSSGNVALIAELLSNAAICWVFFRKSDWILEKLENDSSEIEVTIGKIELLEIGVIIVGIMMVLTSASGIFDKLASYAYLSLDTGESQGTPDIFSGLFTLAGGLLILKHHKRVINWLASLKSSESSD